VDVAGGSDAGPRVRRSTVAHVVERLGPSLTLIAVAESFGVPARASSVAADALVATRDTMRRRQRLAAYGRISAAGGPRASLLAALDAANARLFAQHGSHDDHVATGASLTAVVIANGRAYVGHAGASRAYLARGGTLERLTDDDAVFADATVASAGGATLAPRGPRLLWRSFGTQPKLEASVAQIVLDVGDELVLCSSAVHRYVEPSRLAAILEDSDSAAAAVARGLAFVRDREDVDAAIVIGRDLLAADDPRRDSGISRLRRIVVLALVVVALLAFASYALRANSYDESRYSTSGERP